MSLGLGSGAAFASTTEAWRPDFITPCQCDSNVSAAFPRLFANRLPARQEARFIDIEVGLINSFVNASSVPNKDKVILWSAYEFGVYDVANALVAARKAGVTVRVLTDGKSVSLPSRDHAQYRQALSRGELTRDVYAILKNAGIQISYSAPEWDPISTSYSPLMHEKVRIFGIKKGRAALQPLIAYISTHNDTYSDMLGDPISSLTRERLRQGNLSRSELVEGSFGNVQTSFIVRHQGILQSLLKNFDDQFETYGKGRGRIREVPEQSIQEWNLADGTDIRLAYTYAKTRSTYNPNEAQATFITQAAAPDSEVKIEGVRMQQFVFSYGKVAESLKTLASKKPFEIDVLIDGNFAYQPYSQGRKMAGLFSITSYRPNYPLDYPWPRTIRSPVEVRAYVNGHDKLHTKNTLVKYRINNGPLRYRVYTGSLNLSSNGVSNKELVFEIDSPDNSFAALMDSQYRRLQSEGFLRPLAESALFGRLRKTAEAFGARRIEETPETTAAYREFLKGVQATPSREAKFPTFNLLKGSYDDLESGDTGKRPGWVSALTSFYESVGAEGVAENVVNDVEKNLGETERFMPSVTNCEVLMGLSEDHETVKPNIRQAVLGLFK